MPREFEEFARARAPHLYRAAWLLCGEHELVTIASSDVWFTD